METALVTGSSSGIGLEIAKRLTDLNYRVFGLARNFNSCTFKHTRFEPVICDITDTSALIPAVKKILKSEKKLNLLVNNAGIGTFGPVETISPDDITAMVNTNLLAPMILTGQVVNRLRESRGRIINIASTAALKISPNGAVYSATKAGMLHFGDALYEEVRKQGIAVTTICPDITADTGFYQNASFEPHSSTETHILPSCVADAVVNILQQRNGTVISQIVIKPQRFQISKR